MLKQARVYNVALFVSVALFLVIWASGLKILEQLGRLPAPPITATNCIDEKFKFLHELDLGQVNMLAVGSSVAWHSVDLRPFKRHYGPGVHPLNAALCFLRMNQIASLTDICRAPAVDVVHINTPIQSHAEQTLKALRAGKHVACTVPMATTVEECRQIVEETERTGLTYMMMETVIYSREFLFVKEMYEKGELGKIQFLRASHQQDMSGWPGYWEGLPPMHYATHCVGPVLALPKAQAEYVSCFGSGRIDDSLVDKYGSPFAIETCHIKTFPVLPGGIEQRTVHIRR